MTTRHVHISSWCWKCCDKKLAWTALFWLWFPFSFPGQNLYSWREWMKSQWELCLMRVNVPKIAYFGVFSEWNCAGHLTLVWVQTEEQQWWELLMLMKLTHSHLISHSMDQLTLSYLFTKLIRIWWKPASSMSGIMMRWVHNLFGSYHHNHNSYYCPKTIIMRWPCEKNF